MEKPKTPSEKLLEYVKSEEFEKRLDQWIDKEIEKKKKLEIFLEKAHNKFKDRIDQVIEILIKKYQSSEYVLSEYKRGCQPRTELYWTLLSYGQKYGKVCDDEKYLNMFTCEAYYIGSYVVQVMVGQGSCVKVDKV
jgi:hypothetical protein